MDRARSVAGAAALALLVAGGAPVGWAHRVEYPKTDALLLSAQGLALHIEYLVPTADESRLLHRLFDRDRSGQLDEGELGALREHLGHLASAFVRLSLDGKPLTWVQKKAALAMPGGELLALSLTLTADLPPGPGSHTLQIWDRHKDRAQAVPLRVTAQGVRLLTQLPPLPILRADGPWTVEFATDATARGLGRSD
jgi:hypothetical protein